MADDLAKRESLTARQLPQMVLSDGSASSKTAPPTKTSPSIPPQERARLRFQVTGNAVITGGAGDLGLANTRVLLEHGLTGVALFDLNPVQGEKAVKTLQEEFPDRNIMFKQVNVADADAVNAAVKMVAHEFGTIDMLVCFAGVVGCAHAADITPNEWRRVMDINAAGAWYCAQAVGGEMRRQGSGGSIVFIASISAHRVNFPQPQVHYNASKAAVIHLARSLAAEWAVHGIRVNTISPGYMDTILNEGPGIEVGRRIWRSRNPMGRMGQPEELSGPLVMLCSEAGSYVNGADIVVDGGGSVF